MSLLNSRQKKTAPLIMPPDRESFVQWANEEPVGSVAAGWQSPNPLLARERSCAVRESAGFKAAALLEEIAKRADPSLVLQRSLNGLLANARSAEIGFTVTTDPDTKTVTAQYAVSAEVVLVGVNNTPEEILEYLKSGLSEFESARLTDAGFGTRYFVITQLRQDDHIIQKIHKLLDDRF